MHNLTAIGEGNYGLQTLGDPCTSYDEGSISFIPYASSISNGSRPPLDSFDSLAAGYEYGNQPLQNAVHGFGSPNAVYDNGPRYPLNDIHGSSVAYGHGLNAAQTAGFGGNPANGRLNHFGTIVVPSIVSGPDNNAAYDWPNGASSSSGGLTAPIGDYGLGNCASEGVTYRELYPFNDTGATGALYGHADATGLAAYTGNVDKGLHDVDTILAPNAIQDQDNYARIDPSAGNSDHVLFNVDRMAIPSAIHHGSANARYSTNAANIHDGLLPIDNLAALNPEYDGAGAGPQNAGFNPQSSGPTFAVGSALSPSNTSGSVTAPDGRPRYTGVDHRGRPRWVCENCDKTFGRSSDMQRHAQKHSGVLQYRCNVVGCSYPGSYRQDKLEQHRRNCH